MGRKGIAWFLGAALLLGGCTGQAEMAELPETVCTVAPTDFTETPRQTEAETTEAAVPEEELLETTQPAAVTEPAETEPPETEEVIWETEPAETVWEEPAPPQTELPAEPEPAAPEQTAPPEALVTPEALLTIRSEFMRLCNQERVRVGAVPLTENAYLSGCAAVRSEEITYCWSHTRPDGTPFQTAVDPEAYPYSVLGENIAISSHLGTQTFSRKDLFVSTDGQIAQAAETMFALFCSSSSHYAEMTDGKFQECGVGISYRIDAETGMPLFAVSQILAAKA